MVKVMIFGTFDIVHCGHLHMFKEAKDYGDKLIVVVARDKNVEVNKGGETLHDENERVEFLQHLRLVDEAILGDEFDVYKVIANKKPDIIALGYDQKIYVDKLAKAITNFGLTCKIVKLSPYKENKFKTNKIRKRLEKGL